MFTTSRPPGRSTRRSSASAAGGSTAPWHSTSAASAASKQASAKGRALTLPRATGAPRLRRGARCRAASAHSRPTSRRSGRARAGRRATRRCRSRRPARAPCTPASAVEQARVQGAVPPHAVLGGVHQGVFGGLHRFLFDTGLSLRRNPAVPCPKGLRRWPIRTTWARRRRGETTGLAPADPGPRRHAGHPASRGRARGDAAAALALDAVPGMGPRFGARSGRASKARRVPAARA